MTGPVTLGPLRVDTANRRLLIARAALIQYTDPVAAGGAAAKRMPVGSDQYLATAEQASFQECARPGPRMAWVWR
ncbi:hypothetical protein D0Z08_04955 [Nocardioides immobilis]|uniref:Uncharacterized protein n=1 Tax=Nocardioides immobilis TaxID=2049295 RepID=A0A417Y6V2_9ACTN|nr:hypothetical protein D0Z08_04955 [Nocardioides immobilis]